MKVTEKFQCDNCGEIHDYEEDASECCLPEVITLYICGGCDEDYRTRQDAEACCDGDALYTEEGWQKHVESLERAGQQRLIP